MRRKIALIMVGMMLMVGCGETESTESNNVSNEETSKGSNDTETGSKEVLVDIADIDWSVNTEIVDKGVDFYNHSSRQPVFKYKNNSPYTILDIELTYRLKEGYKVEELSAHKTFQTILSIDDEGMKNWKDKCEVRTNNQKMVRPGGTSDISKLWFNGYPLIKQEDFEPFEPDVMTIKYTDNDKDVHSMIYDCVNGTSKYNGLVTDEKFSDEWDENDEYLALVPKPDFGRLEIDKSKYSPSVDIKTKDATKEQILAYIEQCKSMGWTLDAEEDGGYYLFEAKNQNKPEYEIHIRINDKVGNIIRFGVAETSIKIEKEDTVEDLTN